MQINKILIELNTITCDSKLCTELLPCHNCIRKSNIKELLKIGLIRGGEEK